MFKKFVNSTKYLYGITLPEVLVSTALLLVFLSVKKHGFCMLLVSMKMQIVQEN